MKDTLRNMMAHITQLTQSGRLHDATAAIQRALGGWKGAPRKPAETPFSRAPTAEPGITPADVIDIETRWVNDGPGGGPAIVTPMPPHAFVWQPQPAAAPTEPSAPGAGGFIDGSFTNAAGTRPYKLFIPGGACDAPRALVVMLHGCKQNPADFAAGTRMNELAKAQGVVVLYPGQVSQANQMGCWNWFKSEDQRRGLGEPSIIAGMTQHIIETHGIDRRRVYIAGLSAGGAMAAVMAATYPELYAAVGIHSGLPHAAANSLPSALSAMRHGPAKRGNGGRAVNGPAVPTIVFHGDQDTTVHPDNGEEVIAQARWSSAAHADHISGAGMSVEKGEVTRGHRFTRTLHRDAHGRCDAEHWLVHGAGHAWAGGSPSGSYTDPRGPDASGQMLRFFLEHPRAA